MLAMMVMALLRPMAVKEPGGHTARPPSRCRTANFMLSSGTSRSSWSCSLYNRRQPLGVAATENVYQPRRWFHFEVRDSVRSPKQTWFGFKRRIRPERPQASLVQAYSSDMSRNESGAEAQTLDWGREDSQRIY